jgi:hypothetical protein
MPTILDLFRRFDKAAHLGFAPSLHIVERVRLARGGGATGREGVSLASTVHRIAEHFSDSRRPAANALAVLAFPHTV